MKKIKKKDFAKLMADRKGRDEKDIWGVWYGTVDRTPGLLYLKKDVFSKDSKLDMTGMYPWLSDIFKERQKYLVKGVLYFNFHSFATQSD